MAKKQKTLIVEYSPSWFSDADKTRAVGGPENWNLDDGNGVNEINRLLDDGWRVSQVSAMGGTGGGDAKVLFRSYAALVVLERESP